MKLKLILKFGFFFLCNELKFWGFLKVLEQHQSLSRLWDNYKYLLDESITSFKHLKVKKKPKIRIDLSIILGSI
jgi:hypothetical protein